MTQVEVACLPQNLPEFIEIDLFDVEIDGIVHMSDLKLPEGVRIPALQHDAEHDQAVVTINKPKGVKTDAAEEEGGKKE